MTVEVEIWTDGACSGNPGPGGWGALLKFGDHRKEICGGEPDTTNNRMELMGAIEALKALKGSQKAILHTDSSYVKQGITTWVNNWQKKNWRTASGSAVKNVDLWKALLEVAAAHDVDWRWVKGHAGDPGNERADELARRGLEEARAHA